MQAHSWNEDSVVGRRSDDWKDVVMTLARQHIERRGLVPMSYWVAQEEMDRIQGSAGSAAAIAQSPMSGRRIHIMTNYPARFTGNTIIVDDASDPKKLVPALELPVMLAQVSGKQRSRGPSLLSFVEAKTNPSAEDRCWLFQVDGKYAQLVRFMEGLGRCGAILHDEVPLPKQLMHVGL
ncbi:unnamed protein product, partial [Polarella glacialis]